VTTRRRGDVLERAVGEAVLAELKVTGYAALTIDGVAARARCGKASLYRRWPGKRELVLAVLGSRLPPPPAGRRDASARQNLRSALGSLSEMLIGDTRYPALFVIVGMHRDVAMQDLYRELVMTPWMKSLQEIITAGVSSGEIDPASVTALTGQIGPALVIQHVLLTGTVPSRSELNQIVDAVIGRPNT
jgi:AcrR family transcriptional regulator